MKINRSDWQIQKKASEVADGARAQMLFRMGRVKWWQDAKASVIAKIKESGIEVTESMAADIRNYSTKALMAPQVSIRADLADQLTEAHRKIEAHQAAANEYDAWVQFLSDNPNMTLELTQNDWMYFFGKAG